jgi:hypothetical protein
MFAVSMGACIEFTRISATVDVRKAVINLLARQLS